MLIAKALLQASAIVDAHSGQVFEPAPNHNHSRGPPREGLSHARPAGPGLCPARDALEPLGEFMKHKIALITLLLALTVSPAFAQLGGGIVFDPTNYKNAVL